MTSGIEIKLNVECPIVKLNHENFRMVIKQESKEGKTNFGYEVLTRTRD